MAVAEVQLKELVKQVEYLERGFHRLEIALEPLVAPASEVSPEGLSEKERGGLRCAAPGRVRNLQNLKHPKSPGVSSTSGRKSFPS